MTVELYCMGKVPWQESQLGYHALAHLGRESLTLVSPATPYVCVGYHQDARQEIDLDFCRDHSIPVFRREVGGGAVYLDGNQIFFQLVLRRDSPLVPLNKEVFYRKFLQPAIEVYRRIGIPAQYKSINDIITGTKKISGTGAGEIGDCVVFVGNLIIDFDYATMSRVLNVPDERFRARVHKTIEDNLSTVRRELGEREACQWTESALNALMVQEFEKVLGPLRPREPDDELMLKMEELGGWMTDRAWLCRRGRRFEGRNMKIRSGVNVVHRVHQAPGGLIRADFEIRDGVYQDVSLSCDYLQGSVPSLEQRIAGISPEKLARVLGRFYDENRIEARGITVDDWLKVLKA